MNLLPYLKIEMPSKMDSEKLLALLNVRCLGRHSMQGSAEPLVGSINGNSLKAARAITYRNSFLPIAVGEVLSSEAGSVIRVHLRPPIFSILFMTVWFGTLLCILVALLSKGNYKAVVPVALLLGAGYIFVQLCFWLEVPKIENVLRSIASNG